MRKEIKYIVIHCTATQPHVSPSAILSYWRNNLGWKNPGYHILIEDDGTVHQLLPFDKISNGVKGHNSESINISYIGGINADGFPKDTRTLSQQSAILDSIRKALEWVMSRQNAVPEIIGHRDLNPQKACPSFNAKRELGWITV